MISSTHQKIVCVLIVLSAAVVAYSQSNPTKEATGVVTGKVTIKGKPAPGIVISLRLNERNMNARTTTYKATTDIEGEYRIANVPAGSYILVPLAPAFVDPGGADQPRTLLVNKGETIEHIDIALVHGAAITGKVVDADGRPVVEQVVDVFVLPNKSYSGLQAQTDDRGIYRIYGLKAGSYKVSVGQGDEGRFPGHPVAVYKRIYYPSVSDVDQATVIELNEGGEAKDIDITLGRAMTTYTASGRIVDETGQPLPNVEYGVTRYISQNSRSSMSNGAVSNSRGEFKLDDLVPGRYSVFVRAERDNNWRADEVPFEVVDDDVTGLVVQAKKGAAVSGTVVVEGGDDKRMSSEFQRVLLTASPAQPTGIVSSAWSQVAADGSFRMSGLAAGATMFRLANESRFSIVRVERNGVALSLRTIEIKEGENISGLRVVLTYGNATIRGAVEIASGTLPPGARFFVSLRNTSEDPSMSSASNSPEVDARGQFVVEGLQPGTYEINAGIMLPERHVMLGMKKQQVAVTAGSVNNVTLSVDIPNLAKP